MYTANGDAYTFQGTNTWGLLGNVFGSGGPTPAVSQPTWGQLKAKYATPQGKAGQVKGDR